MSMTLEIEKLIRDKVNEFKASGKRLARGSYKQCVVGVLGEPVEVDKLLGYPERTALECGFEGWEQGKSAILFPDFYELGRKIAEENGL